MIRKGMFISDRYEIIDKVGSGGMSDVYKAMDHKLNRYVAIKVLKSEFSEDTGFVSKFRVEAQSAAGLTHPNIVNVYDVGEDNGIYYIVMELIEGITLKKYIEKKGKLPIKEAVSIAIQVAQGIEAAHNNHIIHRDIKPQNIMISREGKVKVTDFGIARAASSHTINGNAMGSVHYISPEQAKGGYIDEKSDIYSLGISLFEMITGEVPFEGDSTVSVALQHINEEMPNPRDYVEELPVSVEKILAKCTQKKPERRYLKVSTLIADLKKSLITPDEDFVQMAPASETGTVVLLSKDEAPVIKKNPGDEISDKTEERNYDDSLSDDDDVFGTDDDIDSVSPKLDKIITISGIVGAVVVAVVVILVLIKAFGGCDSEPETEGKVTTGSQQSTLSDKQTIVPNVVGKAEDDAISELEKSSLGFKIDKRESSNSYPKGFVMDQSVAKDTVVDKHTTILLTISDGPKEITIPDVKNKSKTDAQKLLEGEEYGLVVTFDYEISDEIDIDNVIRTEPEIGASAKYGDSIKLIVSQGPDTSDVEVPKLEDKTEEKAKEELAELGLTLKVIEERHSDTVEKGRIINQNIASGKSVPRGTEIGVVISLGKEEPTTPEPTTPEPTTPEPTTPPEKKATFAGVSASDITGIPSSLKDKDGKDIPVTGTVSVSGTYKLQSGDTANFNIELDENEAVFSENWTLGQKEILREAESGSEATMTVKVEYVTYVNEGTEEEPVWKEKKETASRTFKAVFQ